MAKQVITIPGAPARPLSPGVKAGGFIFVSGQVGHEDPKTGEAREGIAAQTKQCLENIKRVLELAGSSLDDVVKTTVFLGNVVDLAEMNEVYRSYFPKDPPARSTLVAGLVRPGMLIEIECIASVS